MLDALLAVEDLVRLRVRHVLDLLAGLIAVARDAVRHAVVAARARAPHAERVERDLVLVARVIADEPAAAAGRRTRTALAPAHDEVGRLVVDRAE